jgi:hypothetical protein
LVIAQLISVDSRRNPALVRCGKIFYISDVFAEISALFIVSRVDAGADWQ